MLNVERGGYNMMKTEIIHGWTNVSRKTEKNYWKGKEKQDSAFDVINDEWLYLYM